MSNKNTPQDASHRPAVGGPVERQVRPGAEARHLVERLRACSIDPMWADHAEVPKNLCAAAAAEIERLRAALTKANEQAERFERGWYLRGDALEKLQGWADAYPLTVFPEPDFAKAYELLQAGGMTLDAISASNMRHVISGVRKLVDEGLRA